jgi:CheY-like chemotaxis protein
MEKIRKVLVVDDEDMVRVMVGRFLEGLPLQIELAENGEVGLQCVLQREFDLVITDFQMPRMDGEEFMVQVREQFPLLPFIVMSAYIDEDIDGRGDFAFLKKPFRRGGLRQLVGCILRLE